MAGRPTRNATVEELQALAHPLRWRILRLCLDKSWTNQQLAQRLELSPATTLRHVRALEKADFLTPEPIRHGERGAIERPYRATRHTWGLAILDLDDQSLVQQVDLATLAAHRAELVEAGPQSSRDISRGVMRLNPESVAELQQRLAGLLAEFSGRDDSDGENLSYLWSLAARSPHD